MAAVAHITVRRRIGAVGLWGQVQPAAEPAAPSAETQAALAQCEARYRAQAQQAQAQLEAHRKELQQARDALAAALAEVAELRRRVLAEAEAQVVDLSLAIARKVLMQEIQAGRYEVEPIVREALSQVPVGGDIVVRLHPADCQRCGGLDEASGGAQASIRLVADPAVAPAQCVVETRQGTVESSIESHLANVAGALRSAES